MAKVIAITQKLEAARLASMHARLLASIFRLQENAQKLDDATKVKNAAEIDGLVEEGLKDCNAIEAGYLALTGNKLKGAV